MGRTSCGREHKMVADWCRGILIASSLLDVFMGGLEQKYIELIKLKFRGAPGWLSG